MQKRLVVVFILSFLFSAVQSQELTYAERLGFPKGSKVIILHIDDVGMSWDSNQGAIESMEKALPIPLAS